MQRLHTPPNRIIAATAVCALVTTAMLPSTLHANELQVGRYSSLEALPTEAQRNLLAVVSTIEFQDEVTTVGEALRTVLVGSGYRLAPLASSAAPLTQLLVLPLPNVHRSLGPMTLAAALQTLVGPTFRLVEDPMHRLIGFDVCAHVANEVRERVADDQVRRESQQWK